jgi:hypothetical protein
MYTRNDAARAHWELTQQNDLPMFTVYDSPLDHPGKFVVRLFRTIPVAQPTHFAEVFDTLEQARQFIPPGLVCLTRAPQDDAKIVEVWL